MRKAFKSGPRGLYGDWKGRLYMPKLARDGYLDGKVVASNHFYMAFLNSLSRLVHSAASVLLMTGHEGLLPAFQLRFPDREIALLKIGNATDPRRGKLKVPYFLQDYHDAMPEDLTGVLCLVGGGPWSLIYCSWIRQRGGVAKVRDQGLVDQCRREEAAGPGIAVGRGPPFGVGKQVAIARPVRLLQKQIRAGIDEHAHTQRVLLFGEQLCQILLCRLGNGDHIGRVLLITY